MNARTNQQTLDAVAKVDAGMAITKAAKECGIHRTTLWRALIRESKRKEKLK